jgi:ankyrin repeat protein
MASTPTQEQYEEFVLACRFGDLEDVEAFTKEFGFDAINDARDDRGNTALHMICGNGHLGALLSKSLYREPHVNDDDERPRRCDVELIPDVLKHLIPHLSKSTLEAKNANGSPAIHWAVFNNHLPCVKALVEEVPEERGGGISILKVRRAADLRQPS